MRPVAYENHTRCGYNAVNSPSNTDSSCRTNPWSSVESSE